jgi:hypothetical protein
MVRCLAVIRLATRDGCAGEATRTAFLWVLQAGQHELAVSLISIKFALS